MACDWIHLDIIFGTGSSLQMNFIWLKVVVKYQVLNGYYMYSTSPLMFLMLSSM